MGVGGVFAALHNNHFRPPHPEVKNYFVRRSNKMAQRRKFNGLEMRKPAEAGPHIAMQKAATAR
jgi:hypothetical protein